MFQLFNTQYNRQDLEGFSAPFKRRIDLVGFKIALYHDLKIEIIFVGT
jgi:hypothetical protein